MSSIYNSSDNQEIINRINQLNQNSQPQWGKMTVDQMLSHCQAPIDVAFGDLKLKSNFLFLLLGKMIKGKMLKSKHFQKNSPTAKDFTRTGQYDFEQTKADLIKKVKTFETEGTNAIKVYKHPFFGKMTVEEWDNLQWKHLDHHLYEFGV
ncbi:DUF1569 domain-containing protein [Flavobacterium sp.]|uniref:DUF1569 domain-containing protein n=1 Tax=Flavobacterium sp. TaxID=239 RepID=UPI00375211C3